MHDGNESEEVEEVSNEKVDDGEDIGDEGETKFSKDVLL